MPDAISHMAVGLQDPLPDWVGIAGLMLDFGYTEREIMEDISPAMIERMSLLAEARQASERAKGHGGGSIPHKPRRAGRS